MTPRCLPLLLLLPAVALAGKCDDVLDVDTRNSIHQLIHTSPVALIAMKNVRCTIAAQSRLEHANVCYKSRIFTDPDSKLWAYMKCLHPETNMHSYVYIGGEDHGDGFSLLPDTGDSRGAGISDADLHAKRPVHSQSP